MDRREFIKNLCLVGGCCLVGSSKFLLDDYFNKSDKNLIQLKNEYLSERYKNKKELPNKIRLEACSLCQLNCVQCWVRAGDSKRKPGELGYLAFKDFKKIVDDNYFESIELSNRGEIFLNPELVDIIKYAYKKNITLSAFTGVNLNYLPDKVAEALVKYNFHAINVSIDGATSETYKIYRRGGDFDAVMSNIDKINYYKRKYNWPFPRLIYKFILFGHNEHEVEDAKKLAKKLNMEMQFYQNYNQNYSPVKNVELVKKQTGIDPTVDLSRLNLENYKKDYRNWIACKQLWETPQIDWDGTLLGCCWDQPVDFGINVFDKGFFSAMNSPQMIYAKNMLTKSAPPLDCIKCSYCTNYKFLQHNNLVLKSKARTINMEV